VSSARAEELKAALHLEVLAGESGWWRLLRESAVPVTVADGGALPASNTIHFLLSPDRPVNIWHLLASDDVHVLVEGGPVEYVVLPPSGPARREVLTVGGDRVVTVPAGEWTAVHLLDPDGYAWVVSTVTPAWTEARAVIGLPVSERARWLDAEPWLTASLLDALNDPSERDARDR